MKLLIGAVTHKGHRYLLDFWASAVKKQNADVLCIVPKQDNAYGTLLKSMNFSVLEVAPEKTFQDQLLQGRRLLRKHALQNGYDALLLINGDIIVPDNARELLEKTQGDVVAGVYLNAFELGGKTVVAPFVFKDVGDGNAQLYTYDGIAAPQVLEVGAAGLGCVLISKKVLEKVEFQTFGKSGTEDMRFFVDARAAKFKCVVNTVVKCLQAPFPLDDPRIKAYQWSKQVYDYTIPTNY